MSFRGINTTVIQIRRQVFTEVARMATRYRMTGDDRVELHPLTGRTHQLRVHCAHSRGLGRPILGDPLYGHGGDRLYLHAQSLSFIHPVTGKPMTVCSPPPF